MVISPPSPKKTNNFPVPSRQTDRSFSTLPNVKLFFFKCVSADDTRGTSKKTKKRKREKRKRTTYWKNLGPVTRHKAFFCVCAHQTSVFLTHKDCERECVWLCVCGLMLCVCICVSQFFSAASSKRYAPYSANNCDSNTEWYLFLINNHHFPFPLSFTLIIPPLSFLILFLLLVIPVWRLHGSLAACLNASVTACVKACLL